MDTSEAPPGTTIWPTRHTLDEWLANKYWEDWDSVAIDIECAGHFITIIGYTFFDMDGEVGPTLVLPYKKRLGLDYWDDWGDHVQAALLSMKIMEWGDHTKVFHNGITFDVPMLREAGFTVNGEFLDTMILSHYCYPEMKKGLQYLSTAYLGAPAWKRMLDEREGKD